jgi:hypothetical protein
MKTRDNTKRIAVLAVATAIAAVAIPMTAAARPVDDPGLVARKLGSPDPREAVVKSQYSPGRIASRLGSPDPRETGLTAFAPSAVATTLGSPDPQETGGLAESVGIQSGSGFDWGDFAIGLALGIGLAAIVAGALIVATVAVRGRSVAQPLA